MVKDKEFKLVMLKFIFFYLLSFSLFAQTEIPPLIPNVVDQTNTLSSEQIQSINQKISDLKKKSDIWAAVFIVQKLNNETIEDLSERTFQTWKLGEKGKDNGLLLVLSMDDRKSRFEVGYNLEATLTDSETRYVLDHVLAPFMRRGKVDQAIEKSLEALMNNQGGESMEDLPVVGNNIDRILIHRSVIIYAIFLIFVWGTGWIEKLFIKFLLQRLRKKHPEAQFEHRELYVHDTGWRNHPFKPHLRKLLFIRLFFTINPGLFILILSAISIEVALGILLLIFLGFWIVAHQNLKIFMNLKNYTELENAYKNFLSQMSKYINNGYVLLDSSGKLFYTPKWYQSHEFKALKGKVLNVSAAGNISFRYSNEGFTSGSSWSSGSRSSSSFSSSSGGGRSGGGGSSSSW